MQTKQVIVMRKDLNMRKGKMVAQGSHASIAFITKYVRLYEPDVLNNTEYSGWELGDPCDAWKSKHINPAEVKAWLEDSFTKVCLYVESEAELQAIHDAAWAAGLHSVMVTDSGLTEFHGVPTKTCLAIGPHESSRIDAVTGHLKLL